jgi:hypothetical protein
VGDSWGIIMSRVFADTRIPSLRNETATALTGRLRQASWRERIAALCFVGIGVFFWVAVVLAFVG